MLHLPRPSGTAVFTDWEKTAKDLVAALRSEAGRNPHDRALTDLIGELSTRTSHSASGGRPQRPLPPDRPQTAAPPDRRRPRARIRNHGLTADSGLRLAVFTAGPGTRSGEALEVFALSAAFDALLVCTALVWAVRRRRPWIWVIVASAAVLLGLAVKGVRLASVPVRLGLA